jgi:tRNA G10  N-methylase Trm11
VDAIVTDFPYGKSTTTKGEEKKQLYTRSFENINKLYLVDFGFANAIMIN